MKGIIKCDPHKKVDVLDWAMEHLGCDALICKDSPVGKMIIVAYAESPEYNGALQQLLTEKTTIFANMRPEEVNSID